MLPDQYLSSLKSKLDFARYHYETAWASVINEPWALYLLEDKKDQACLACSAEFTAMMLTLHSSLDILAQYINSKTLLCPEDKMSFKRLLNQLDQLDNPLLRSKLRQLEETTIYMNDFVNTTKHRNIIDICEEQNIATGVYMEYLIIKNFNRNGHIHREKGLFDLMKDTFVSVTEQINDIISEITKA